MKAKFCGCLVFDKDDFPEKYSANHVGLQINHFNVLLKSLFYTQKIITISTNTFFVQESSKYDYSFLFPKNGGHTNFNIEYSPITEILDIYEHSGPNKALKHFPNSRYYKLLSMVKHTCFSDDFGVSRLKRLFRLHDSIKSLGYLGPGHENEYITVAEKPVIVSRYGEERHWEPYTIIGGHHRASSLYVLGYDRVKVILVKDLLDQSFINP